MTLSRKETYSTFAGIEQASWKKLPIKFKPVEIEDMERKGEEGLETSRKKEEEHVTMIKRKKWPMEIIEGSVIKCASVSSKEIKEVLTMWPKGNRNP